MKPISPLWWIVPTIIMVGGLFLWYRQLAPLVNARISCTMVADDYCMPGTARKLP